MQSYYSYVQLVSI